MEDKNEEIDIEMGKVIESGQEAYVTDRNHILDVNTSCNGVSVL